MKAKNIYLIPLSIIIAGALIGGGLAYGLATLGKGGTALLGSGGSQGDDNAGAKSITLREVTKDDHIRGDFNARLTLVEYSDLECPFCKRFHPTMQQVVKEYPGKVRWVYRHFPLTQIHPKSPKEAEASECAAEQGKFWEYVDRLYEVTPSNNGLDPAELPKIAAFVKLDAAKFSQCLSSGKYAKKVQADSQDAVSAGSQGTPNTILVDAKGEKTTISGAQPYENVKALIDSKL
ncbi:MAG: thioredoxin domain-containing protein [Candidatus Portnoybacteria bacterium]|nr:thioredoxin domain-containing protein [Candidatus Portnoybacteria bacterium]